MRFRRRLFSKWLIGDGFRIARLDRCVFVYEDAGFSALVGAEMMADGETYCVFTDQIRKTGTPTDGVSDLEIVSRVADSIRWQGLKADIV